MSLFTVVNYRGDAIAQHLSGQDAANLVMKYDGAHIITDEEYRLECENYMIDIEMIWDHRNGCDHDR